MAGSQIPSGGLTLVGWPAEPWKATSKNSTVKRTAALVRVNKQIIEDLRRCAQDGKTIRLLGGHEPKLEVNKQTIGLNVESEKFTNELYTPATESNVLTYTASITQRATLLQSFAPAPQDTAATDDALASLKQSLASYKQDKESKQATISSSVIPSNKANKILSNRYVPNTNRPSSSAPSPQIGSSKPLLAPTSAPHTDPTSAAKIKAMSYAVIHLLAAEPRNEKVIWSLTRIDTALGREICDKVGEYQKETQDWKLKDKYFKDLFVWEFNYKRAEDRQNAINNAVRAYDRMRLGKDDKLWQMLLPEKERGQGKCLSRLHGARLNAPQARKSPLGSASPAATSDTEGKTANGRLTPKPTSTSMSRTASAPGRPISIEKRFKDSQKQRAAEEAKTAREAKRKEKDTTKETKHNAITTNTIMKTDGTPKATKKKANSQFKSDDIVHSSDDESEGEIKEKSAAPTRAVATKPPPRRAGSPSGTSSSDGKPLMKTSSAARAAQNAAAKSVNGGSTPSTKRDTLQQPTAVNGKRTPIPTSTPNKVGAKTSTPLQRPEKHALPARPQASPHIPVTKPKTSSPPGRSAAPSLFGNHERAPTVVKKVAPGTSPKPARSGTPAARPAEVASKKRAAPSAADDQARPRKATKTEPLPAAKKPASTIARNSKSDAPLKRKANDISTDVHDHDLSTYTSKHRRTESSSTQSVTFSSSSNVSLNTTARTSVASPSPPLHAVGAQHGSGWQGSPSDTSSSNSDPSRSLPSWERALDEAALYRRLYPEYVKMHEALKRKKPEDVTRVESVRLWELHSKLVKMKRLVNEGSVMEGGLA